MISKHDFLLILTLRIAKASGSYVIGQAENKMRCQLHPKSIHAQLLHYESKQSKLKMMKNILIRNKTKQNYGFQR